MGEPLRGHPWRWLLVAVLLAAVTLEPRIDLTVAGWFYAGPVDRWPFRIHPLGEFARKELPKALFAAAAAVVVLWAAGEMRRRPVWGVTRRAAASVILSLAVGPGLIVNALLKDNWGRARPSTIAEFGGPDRYTPALLPTDQCPDNCSFVSGHAALAFWTVSFAYLAPPRFRPWAVGAALLFGAAMGVVRIAQGGHFLSDVAYAGAITVGVAHALHEWIVTPGNPASPKNFRPGGRKSPVIPYAAGPSSGNDMNSD